MKIASLLSSATEIVCELGLADQLVAISHECDHPPEVLRLPRTSRPRFDPTELTSDEIDAAVRRSMEESGSVYEVDADALAELAPDLLLTQAVCEVCAVPTGSAEAAIASLARPPEIVSLDAHTVEGILASVQQVADAAGVPERGRSTVGELRARLDAVRRRVAGAARPGVLALEWLAPPFVPGHWIPEMVDLAGGVDLIGRPGLPSVAVAWEPLERLDPDVLLLAPCGYDLERARADARAHQDRLEEIAPRAFATDQVWIAESAFISRSGPRVIEGVEALASIFHPADDRRIDVPGRVERL